MVIFLVDAIALSEREIQKLGKDPEVAVKLPEDLGGGYMGTIEGWYILTYIPANTTCIHPSL